MLLLQVKRAFGTTVHFDLEGGKNEPKNKK